MATSNKLVLLDTNCLVRVYFSSLRPVLSRPASGYEFKTLAGLAKELKNLAIRPDLAWLSDKVIQSEVDAAVVPLTRAQRQAVEDDTPAIQKHGNGELLKHCVATSRNHIRTLSRNDAKVLAASLELGAAMATDEWPLRLVAGFYDYDDGKPVELFSSVELIALLEREGLLTRDDRIRTYSGWLKSGENLLAESPEIYQDQFGEKAPTAQD